MRRVLVRALVLAFIFALTIPSNVAYADPTHPPKRLSGPGIQPMAAEYDPGGGSPSSLQTSGSAYACLNESRNPHVSAHQPGNVNAEGITQCTAPVYLTIHAKLYKEFAWLWWWPLDESPVLSGYGTINVFVNAPCAGNLNYRIVTDHTDPSNSVRTANTQYVACQ